MCTVSWFLTDSGYELFFNRDERISRAKALPPQKKRVETCNTLSPIDKEAGGSWISVNELGLSVCLLNLYTQSSLPEGSSSFTSRGVIIQKLMSCYDLQSVSNKVSQFDLSQFRTFRVLAIDAQGNNIMFIWDGIKLAVEMGTQSPKSSSSLEGDKVRETRKAIYRDKDLDSCTDRQQFLSFHRGHEPNKEYGVCVHRENTQTVSLSHIVVNSLRSEFNYFPDSPCQTLKPMTTFIERSQKASVAVVA